jgi:uncharacterized protein YgbK (DUF1537 family)
LAGPAGGQWIVVNATEYSDLEAVACGVLLAERAGKSFLFRTGPSFVRALSGLGPRAPLRDREIWPSARRSAHGLVVAGSYTDRTNRQLAALPHGAIARIELDVPSVLDGSRDVAAETARQVAAALGRSGVLLYTSRAAAAGSGGADSLAIGRNVSAALSLPSGRWPRNPPGLSPRVASPRMTLRYRASGAQGLPGNCSPV